METALHDMVLSQCVARRELTDSACGTPETPN